jgi:tripartite-type tricarboxylate transporter receptor subunit TctC
VHGDLHSKEKFMIRRFIVLHGRRAMLVAGMVLAGITVAAPVHAQSSYPSKPIQWIVPFAPGGLSDIVTRLVAGGIQRELGQNVVVENRPGAGGAAGTGLALRAPADGYTLITVSPSNTTLSKLIPKGTSYDWEQDMAMLANLAASPNILAARPGLPATQLKDVLAASKPSSLTYATSGLGTPGHFNCELLKIKTGANLIAVPYQGGAPALTDVAGDRVDLLCTDYVTAKGLLGAGKIKPLLILNTQRAKQLPNVRSVSEEGLPDAQDFDSGVLWIGVAVQAKTPPDIVQKLRNAIDASLRQAEVRAGLENTGATVATASGDAFRTMVLKEQQTFQRTITAAKLKFD